MRIHFNSKKSEYKTPFGCVRPSQTCHLEIQIPASVNTTAVTIVVTAENGMPFMEQPMGFLYPEEPYHRWGGELSFPEPGLFFYYFRITGSTGTFRLFKYGDETNMEAGDCWQITCIPESFQVPQWAEGAVIYQIFPDRFCKAGDCSLAGKLEPYVLHSCWDEEVFWQPNEKGEILNNDFYGGNFRGITQKLPYIASLGTTLLYLNPICKAFSSHRYDTADYKTPDPMLGTMEDFTQLCQTAHSLGIRVVLDGVFSHTGADSVYFNKYGTFGSGGAYQDPQSPYRSWYDFISYPQSYHSWWGFDTLPTVKKLEPGFVDYIIEGEDSVLAHWLRAGADGFRLDVADELPGEFLLRLKRRLRALKPDALLIGEVWEDASNKISYNTRCRYFTDGVLDSVMNYPFRNAILDFLWSRDGGEGLKSRVMTILENYPQQVVHANMNLLGTHDTPRILTALVDNFDGSRQELSQRFLSADDRKLATGRLLLATVLQFTLPGSPSIYYADEAGAQGGKDPFNRRPFPWGREDTELLAHYRALGQLKKREALRRGALEFTFAGEGKLRYTRRLGKETIHIALNRNDEPWAVFPGKVLLEKGLAENTLSPMGFCIWEE